jgi:hypothetical protein
VSSINRVKMPPLRLVKAAMDGKFNAPMQRSSVFHFAARGTALIHTNYWVVTHPWRGQLHAFRSDIRVLKDTSAYHHIKSIHHDARSVDPAHRDAVLWLFEYLQDTDVNNRGTLFSVV